jgi:alpha-galactosidase
MTVNVWAVIAALALTLSSGLRSDVADPSADKAQIEGANLRIEFDHNLHSRLIARFDNKEIATGPFVATETVSAANKSWTEFPLTDQKRERVTDAFGAGERLIVTGRSGALTKAVTVTMYAEFPTMAFFDVQYTNTGTNKIDITTWTNNAYTLDAQARQASAGVPAFFSYQSGSYEKRPNWVVPLRANFQQTNYLGMNASDYGGGTPIVDVWRRDVGVAVGHVEPRPKLLSLPVSMPDSAHAKVAVTSRHPVLLTPGESFRTFRTFVAVHQGDYFR